MSCCRVRAAFLLLAVSMTACGPAVSDVEMNAAWELHRTKRPRAAIIELNRLEKKSPDDVRVLGLQAMVYDSLSMNSMALQKTRRIAELNPDGFDAQYSLGIMQVRLGKARSAVESFTRALKLRPEGIDTVRPTIPDILWNRGVAYDNLAEWDKAIADYDRALEIEPDHANVLTNRGYTSLKRQDYAQSLSDLKRALLFDPDLRQAHLNLRELRRVLKEKGLSEEKLLRKAQLRKAQAQE